MRLIDADKLINDIRGSDDASLDVIEAFLDLQPTAYDVDKVINKLIQMSNKIPSEGWDRLISVVKRGGNGV